MAYNSALAKKVGNGDASAVTSEDMNIELINQGANASGNNPIVVTFEKSQRQYSINGKDGKIAEYTQPNILDLVKIGDYIEYDPTYLDAEKTQMVDSSKLTYTSLTGSATEHGNGYTSTETGGGQKFTAKSGLKWRILNVKADKLEIIPGAKELFDYIYNKYGDKCDILTGVPKPRRGITTAGEDKINWVRRLLSEDIKVNIVWREDKPDYCTGKDCILIDDYELNIREWENCGCTGIHFVDAISAMEMIKQLEQ